MQALANVKQLIKNNLQTKKSKSSDLCPQSSLSSDPLHGSELFGFLGFRFWLLKNN